MKNFKHLFTALLLLFSVAVNAHNFAVDGIYYSITDATNKTVAVTYRGSSYSEYSNEYTGSVVIPESVAYYGNTYSVTSIGSSAFYNCSGLKSVVIGNSVTSIGIQAFYGCSKLTSVVIPNSVTSIGYEAFRDCSGLTSIEIPNSVTSIGSSAFYGTAWYNNQPDGVVYAGKVLYKYKGIMPENTSIIIEEGTLGITDYAFSGCTGLTSIEIPNSVTSIGNNAFYGCSGLTSVEIPNSVTSIGDYAFNYCFGLTSIVVEEGNTIYDSRDNCNAIIETSTNTLIVGCKSTVIPTSVTSIGMGAFRGCSGLTSVVIPNSVTSIGNSAFSGTAWYNNQPDGVVYAGKVLYKYKGTMPKNTSIIIEEGTLGITDNAFSGCTGLTSIEILNSVTSIGMDAFSGCTGLTSIEIPNSVTSIGMGAFSSCSGLTSVVIGNSVTSIGDYAFYDCTSLKDLRIEDGEGTLSLGYNTYNSSDTGKGLFYDCPLETLYLGRDLSYKTDRDYGYSPFYNKKTLASVTIGNSVTSIGDYAFCWCSKLTSVVIPNSVTSIGDDAFSGTAWYNNQPDGVVYAGKVLYKYKGTMPENTSIIIEEGTLEITGYAFIYCSGLTSIVIPNSVTSIGGGAFSGCTGLTSIEIPNSVTSIGMGAFYGCSGLTNIEIPGSVTSIEYNAFSGCSGLTSIEIPNSVTSIGIYAFSGCSGLTSVVIGNSVTSIGAAAFRGAPGLPAL